MLCYLLQVCYKKEKGKCKTFLPLIPNLLGVMGWSLKNEDRVFAWKGVWLTFFGIIVIVINIIASIYIIISRDSSIIMSSRIIVVAITFTIITIKAVGVRVGNWPYRIP